MQISFIEELHPLQHIERALDMHVYGWGAGQAESHLKRICAKTELLFDDIFWSSPMQQLYASGWQHQQSDDILSAQLDRERFDAVHELGMREISVVRRILLEQHAEIGSRKHSLLYAEGRARNPIVAMAESQGIEVIDLDEGSVYLQQLLSYIRQEEEMWGNVLRDGSYDRLQQLREGEWIEKIHRSGWLNCGLGHSGNEWGLLDRLSGIGAEHEIALCCSYGPELDGIERERRKILDPAIDSVMQRWCRQ
jgi:hypothetical protein